MVTLDSVKKPCGKCSVEFGGEIITRIVRVGVTFPPELLREFDGVIGEMGYENRSKAIQDAVRLFVAEKKWLHDERGSRAGVLMILYEHEARGLENALTRIQHHYTHIICSTMHIHLSERDCLEAIAVKGNSTEIRKLSDELAAKKGVKLSRTTLVAV
jgi:CopG family nickel-responsive transcriptional regulator